MTHNEEEVAEFYSLFDFRAAAEGRLDSLFHERAHPEMELHPPPGYPDMAVYRGLEEIKGFFRMLTEVWEEWRFEPGEMEEIGEQVLVPVRVHARGRGSGLDLPGAGWHLWAFESGKVTGVRTYGDEGQARRAAGLGDLQSPA